MQLKVVATCDETTETADSSKYRFKMPEGGAYFSVWTWQPHAERPTCQIGRKYTVTITDEL